MKKYETPNLKFGELDEIMAESDPQVFSLPTGSAEGVDTGAYAEWIWE